jgi:hypothetical protein
MTVANHLRNLVLSGSLVVGLVAEGQAQYPTQTAAPPRQQAPQAVRPGSLPAQLMPNTAPQPLRVAQQPAIPQPQPTSDRPSVAARILDPALAQPNEHPLMPALRWAYMGIEEMKQIQDYTCTFVKRERIDGVLGEHQYMFMKVRHNPFSVYIYFLAPADLKGQEVIYINGKNDGKLWGHTTGIRDKMVGTVSLNPSGMLAMKGNRYPITEAGIVTLTQRLIEIAEADSKFGECEVKFFPGAKVSGRTCTCIQVVHPQRRQNFRFNLGRVFVDEELNLPIRYEAYEWPQTEGGAPVLTEEYTYLNLKLNQNLNDSDFDVRNPQYKFRE